MAREKQEKLEFRYFEMPQGSYVLPLPDGSRSRGGGKNTECLHFHNYMEIGFCYGGEGTLFLNGRGFPYFPGVLSVIPPNYPHKTADAGGGPGIGGWAYLYVDAEGFLRDHYQERPGFARDLLTRVYQKAHFLTEEGNPELGDVIQEIFRELRGQELFYKEKLRGLVLSLLVEIGRLCPGGQAQGHREDGPHAAQAKISNALQYVSGHYQEHIRIGMLAEQCSLSETHFRRVFQSVMDMSPAEYVNFVRVHAACRLMERTDSSIEEIAMKTGFVSLATFNRNFRKFMDMPPNQWRRSRNG